MFRCLFVCFLCFYKTVGGAANQKSLWTWRINNIISKLRGISINLPGGKSYFFQKSWWILNSWRAVRSFCQWKNLGSRVERVLIQFCLPAGYGLHRHIRRGSEGSSVQLLLLLDLRSVCPGPRPFLWLGSWQQGLCRGLWDPEQSVSTTIITMSWLNF